MDKIGNAQYSMVYFGFDEIDIRGNFIFQPLGMMIIRTKVGSIM